MELIEIVRDRLKSVPEPHLPSGIGDLGMLRGVELKDDGQLEVQLALPCVACPAISVIAGDVSAALKDLPGVSRVSTRIVWAEAWSKSDVSPDGRRDLLVGGVAL